jgi:hypothetical protein
MAFVRLLLGGLVALLVVVVAVPAIALFDLVIGGTGLGLCPTGLGTCSTTAFTLMELLAILAGALALIGGGIVACLHVLSKAAPRN